MKIALLDDNPEQLERNQRFLNALPVEIVTASLTAKTFLQEVKLSKPDILILDLNLGDSYMTGMEVAFELKLPVLFASSNTPEYVKEMERLKREESLCVDHITKPFTEYEFQKTFTRFLQEVKFFWNQHYVTLDLGKQKRTKIAIESIVYLVADKASGSESNNKQIYFTNRKAENLIDFSFSKMEDKGMLKTQFITIHKSFRVNVNHIKHYNKKEEVIEVEVFNAFGKLETMKLPVSENYQSFLKSFRK
ncbi:LytR/AlgR family response regulator transcription factor [Flavobacterium lacisediminis]|uniref:Response regulator n=1 Tax=Flavobacterium lacisediminis TaxID=2989705 RepID=A0ABT3EKQ9_9FLAO|nr:response regulator [Flavobacterium lacisediminis]MCW1149168.1 response regulator [Flavobacterium lacisediminis]